MSQDHKYTKYEQSTHIDDNSIDSFILHFYVAYGRLTH